MWIFNSLIIAIAMYSKIPMPQAEWNEKNMRYAMCFFPVVGVVYRSLENLRQGMHFFIGCIVNHCFFRWL